MFEFPISKNDKESSDKNNPSIFIKDEDVFWFASSFPGKFWVLTDKMLNTCGSFFKLGYYSYRNRTTGSIFIQSFCQFLLNGHENYDLATIATFVKRKIGYGEGKRELKQMPILVSTMRKRFKLLKDK